MRATGDGGDRSDAVPRPRLRERGRSNYWGVEVHKMGGKKYILGSDRDRGLRIFEYVKGYIGDGQ